MKIKTSIIASAVAAAAVAAGGGAYALNAGGASAVSSFVPAQFSESPAYGGKAATRCVLNNVAATNNHHITGSVILQTSGGLASISGQSITVTAISSGETLSATLTTTSSASGVTFDLTGHNKFDYTVSMSYEGSSTQVACGVTWASTVKG